VNEFMSLAPVVQLVTVGCLSGVAAWCAWLLYRAVALLFPWHKD